MNFVGGSQYLGSYLGPKEDLEVGGMGGSPSGGMDTRCLHLR